MVRRSASPLAGALMASAAALLLGPVATHAQSSPDKIAYGKHLAQECTTCHRADGRGTEIPPIAGLAPDYFLTTMRFYQSGQRTHQVMQSVAASLNEEQLDAIAAYLATLKQPAKQAPAARKK